MELFNGSPFDTLTEDGSNVVVHTSLQRILDWGRIPVGAGEKNHAEVLDSLRKIPRKESWYGMEFGRLMALKAWPEGLKIAARYAKDLPRFTMQSIARRPIWSIEGDEFCRDRWDSGVEECWRSRKRTHSTAKPIIKLTCAIGGLGGRMSDELIWMGAAAFALADSAEAAGYRVEIEAISQTCDTFTNGDGCIQRITVKQADEVLDRESAVMALGCPAFFRWYVIHSRAAISTSRLASDGFGSTTSISRRYHGDLHMPHAYSEEDAAEAVGRLIGQIEALAA